MNPLLSSRLFLKASALALVAFLTPLQVELQLRAPQENLSFTTPLRVVDIGFAEAQAAPGTSNVSCSATNVTLLAADGARRNVMIFNDSDQAVDVKYGATASTSSYTVQIPAQGYWEMAPMPVFTGRIDAIWEAACSGAARITVQ